MGGGSLRTWRRASLEVLLKEYFTQTYLTKACTVLAQRVGDVDMTTIGYMYGGGGGGGGETLIGKSHSVEYGKGCSEDTSFVRTSSQMSSKLFRTGWRALWGAYRGEQADYNIFSLVPRLLLHEPGYEATQYLV